MLLFPVCLLNGFLSQKMKKGIKDWLTNKELRGWEPWTEIGLGTSVRWPCSRPIWRPFSLKGTLICKTGCFPRIWMRHNCGRNCKKPIYTMRFDRLFMMKLTMNGIWFFCSKIHLDAFCAENGVIMTGYYLTSSPFSLKQSRNPKTGIIKQITSKWGIFTKKRGFSTPMTTLWFFRNDRWWGIRNRDTVGLSIPLFPYPWPSIPC